MNSGQSRFIKLNFILYGVLALLVPLSAHSAVAEAKNSLSLVENIEQQILTRWETIEQREGSQTKVIVSGLPADYRAPEKCINALKIKSTKELRIGINSIEVSCRHKRNWSLMLTADIEVWQKVVVLRDHISRGESLSQRQVSLQDRNIADLSRGYFASLEDVTNKVSKRSLRAGTALNPSMVTMPIIIKRGQAITLRVDRPGLSVDMKGIALKKGRKGDKIKVKNSSSEKILYGKILSSELVLID